MNWFKTRWMFLTLMLCAIFAAPLVGQEVAAETDSALMGVFSTILTILGPTLVGILSVPLWDVIKLATNLKGKLPAWAQQLTVPLLAYGLTWVGALTNVILPESLELFTAEHTSALLSAAMAFGIKAGKQAKDK